MIQTVHYRLQILVNAFLNILLQIQLVIYVKHAEILFLIVKIVQVKHFVINVILIFIFKILILHINLARLVITHVQIVIQPGINVLAVIHLLLDSLIVQLENVLVKVYLIFKWIRKLLVNYVLII